MLRLVVTTISMIITTMQTIQNVGHDMIIEYDVVNVSIKGIAAKSTFLIIRIAAIITDSQSRYHNNRRLQMFHRNVSRKIDRPFWKLDRMVSFERCKLPFENFLSPSYFSILLSHFPKQEKVYRQPFERILMRFVSSPHRMKIIII